MNTALQQAIIAAGKDLEENYGWDIFRTAGEDLFVDVLTKHIAPLLDSAAEKQRIAMQYAEFEDFK